MRNDWLQEEVRLLCERPEPFDILLSSGTGSTFEAVGFGGDVRLGTEGVAEV